MERRLKFQEELEALDVGQVYYQPPASVRMTFPCIVYENEGFDSKSANNRNYIITNRYSVTYISKDPETELVIRKILRAFESVSHDRHYVSENLNHEVFTIFY